MSDRPTTHEPLDAEGPGLDPQEICTLPGDEVSERLSWIRDEILPHATRTVRRSQGLDIELESAPGLETKLDRLVALERECCAGITFERVDGPTPGRHRLEIRGADPDARVFRPLLAVGDANAQRGSRAAKAAGVGVLASLFICCVVPLAAGALIGSAAAPLAGLDHPAPIAGGALLGGLLAWWWMGRRPKNARTGSASESTGCGPECG
jgi:hypothetical protein